MQKKRQKQPLSDPELEEILLKLLEPEIFKTTDQIVEELRIEQPRVWQILRNEGEMLFGSSCSSSQQPYTRISQCLMNMSSELCRRRPIGKGYCWSRTEI